MNKRANFTNGLLVELTYANKQQYTASPANKEINAHTQVDRQNLCFGRIGSTNKHS